MLNEIKFDYELSIVGDCKNKSISKKNIKYLGYVASQETLINIYDNHNIMVLPSFTEATPYVVDEALSRKRPVVIFEDIAYIAKDKNGIFISTKKEFPFMVPIDSYSVSKAGSYLFSSSIVFNIRISYCEP